MPAGNLRELRSGAQRAQIVIVTKSPTNLGHLEKQTIKKRLALQSGQQLFFSSIDYDEHIYSATEKLALQTIKNIKWKRKSLNFYKKLSYIYNKDILKCSIYK